MAQYHRPSGTWVRDVAAGKVGAFGTAASSSASSAVAGAGELIIGAVEDGGSTFTVGGSLTTLDASWATTNPIASGYNLSGSTRGTDRVVYAGHGR